MKVIVVLLILLVSCANPKNKLPFLGDPVIQNNDMDYPKVKNFSFINQDGEEVTQKTLENKIYIADFIFLNCPTICPLMNNNLKLVYDKFKTNQEVLFVSHTIDPERDTVEKLKEYSDLLKINPKKWLFLTGHKDSIYTLAEKSYFATAYADKNEPGGYVHSGGFLLIDKNKYIRGVYDGTEPKETQRLINDINVLLTE